STISRLQLLPRNCRSFWINLSSWLLYIEGFHRARRSTGCLTSGTERDGDARLHARHEYSFFSALLITLRFCLRPKIECAEPTWPGSARHPANVVSPLVAHRLSAADHLRFVDFASTLFGSLSHAWYHDPIWAVARHRDLVPCCSC